MIQQVQKRYASNDGAPAALRQGVIVEVAGPVQAGSCLGAAEWLGQLVQ